MNKQKGYSLYTPILSLAAIGACVLVISFIWVVAHFISKVW